MCCETGREALRAALGVLGDVLAAAAILAVAVALKCIVDPA
jgi:hypothetical protein